LYSTAAQEHVASRLNANGATHICPRIARCDAYISGLGERCARTDLDVIAKQLRRARAKLTLRRGSYKVAGTGLAETSHHTDIVTDHVDLCAISNT
jgi:hypothetical protein